MEAKKLNVEMRQGDGKGAAGRLRSHRQDPRRHLRAYHADLHHRGCPGVPQRVPADHGEHHRRAAHAGRRSRGPRQGLPEGQPHRADHARRLLRVREGQGAAHPRSHPPHRQPRGRQGRRHPGEPAPPARRRVSPQGSSGRDHAGHQRARTRPGAARQRSRPSRRACEPCRPSDQVVCLVAHRKAEEEVAPAAVEGEVPAEGEEGAAAAAEGAEAAKAPRSLPRPRSPREKARKRTSSWPSWSSGSAIRANATRAPGTTSGSWSWTPWLHAWASTSRRNSSIPTSWARGCTRVTPCTS